MFEEIWSFYFPDQGVLQFSFCQWDKFSFSCYKMPLTIHLPTLSSVLSSSPFPLQSCLISHHFFKLPKSNNAMPFCGDSGSFKEHISSPLQILKQLGKSHRIQGSIDQLYYKWSWIGAAIWIQHSTKLSPPPSQKWKCWIPADLPRGVQSTQTWEEYSAPSGEWAHGLRLLRCSPVPAVP